MPDPLLEAKRSEAESYVERVCDRLAALGIDADCHVFVGDAASHIVRCTEFEDCDLVLISSRRLGGGDCHASSSVAQKVLQRARLPVMIVGRGTGITRPDKAPQVAMANSLP